MRFGRRPESFSHPDWLFEIKWDGFCALAYIDKGQIVSLDHQGKSQFRDLLFRHGREWDGIAQFASRRRH